ncbi:zinc transporter ZIP4-like [Grus japonensis]|uniref:Zinc transporter ZIP4-like n=1 Tax=Grus japonensis TaxID=30415 RepID=A0ABC9W8V8_GRUJA
MTPLLLLLLLGLGATSRDPPGAAEPVSALEALLSSGSGSLPRGAVESLVGIAAGRAQCRAGPCGKCLSADAVLALAGKSGAAAQLEAAEVPWLGAAILVTLRDPPGACRDADADTGPWAARVRALHRAFTGNGTGNGTGSGPGLREVGELLAAVQHNYRGTDSRQRGVGVSQPCVDAAEVLAAGAAASPRVGAGRVLGALGALVLRGRCLRPPPPPGFFLDYVFHRFGHGAHGLPPEAPGGAQPRGGVPRGGVPHPRRGGEEPATPWKLLGVLGGLFAAFLLEKLLGILLHPREEDDPQDDPDCHPHCDPHCPPPRDPPVGQQQQQAGACGEPVPAMVSARSRHPWVLLGLQSAGLLGGWGVLLLLALYEESILL